MSTHTVNIDGIELVYEKEGSGTPIVFIHGGNASAVWWEHVVLHFMDNHTCFLLEQQGHGRSGRRPDGEYTFARFTVEAISFLEEVSGPAILVGQSQGGGVAMAVAADRPNLVRAVFLEDVVPANTSQTRQNSMPSARWMAALEAVARQTQAEGRGIVAHAYAIGQLPFFGAGLVRDVWPPEQLMFYARFAYGTDPAWYARAGSGGLAWPDSVTDAITERVKCPVHLAYGDLRAGGIVTPEDAEALRVSGPNRTVTHFPGAGHGPSGAFARQFIDDLKAFLARIPA